MKIDADGSRLRTANWDGRDGLFETKGKARCVARVAARDAVAVTEDGVAASSRARKAAGGKRQTRSCPIRPF